MILEVRKFNPRQMEEKGVDEPSPRLIFTDETPPEVPNDCIACRTVGCIMNTGIQLTIVLIPKDIKRKSPNPSMIDLRASFDELLVWNAI
jgi:hypothetical protein